jgi:hypothetical protein
MLEIAEFVKTNYNQSNQAGDPHHTKCIANSQNPEMPDTSNENPATINQHHNTVKSIRFYMLHL